MPLLGRFITSAFTSLRSVESLVMNVSLPMTAANYSDCSLQWLRHLREQPRIIKHTALAVLHQLYHLTITS